MKTEKISMLFFQMHLRDISSTFTKLKRELQQIVGSLGLIIIHGNHCLESTH